MRLVISGDLFAELERVLGYPKFELKRCEIEAVVAEVQSVADLPDHGPEAGDVGNVVHRYASSEAYEVEFLAGDGSTLAVLTLEEDDLRPLERSDTFHVRRVPRD